MLVLYLDTLIIGHKFSCMLNIVNELPLRKELQNCVLKIEILKTHIFYFPVCPEYYSTKFATFQWGVTEINNFKL